MTIRTSFPVTATLVAALWAAGVGCVTNPATGQRKLRLISTEQEIALGRQAAPQLELEFGGKLEDEAVQQYVRHIGLRVAAASERRDVPYEYALLADEEPNAFALPGGKIYVTAGLIGMMANERQLAAALGHETGHVAAGHNIDAIQRQLPSAILADLATTAVGGTGGEVVKVATDIAGAMFTLRYSRQDEYQADQLGIRYMSKAGYNPWGMVQLLETLLQEAGPEPDEGPLGRMFRTHPLTSERIQKAREEIRRKHRRQSPDTADPHAGRFRQIQVRVKQAMDAKR